MTDDTTLGRGRRRNDLRMAVDFGMVCHRCGARLLDEPANAVHLLLRRLAVIGVGETVAAQERHVVLCDDCAPALWAKLETRWWEALDRDRPE